MHRIIYKSQAKPGITPAEVKDLADHAVEKNRRLELTGVLLCDGLTFCQVLEGAKRDVDSMMEVIGRDDRHSHVFQVSDMPVAQRLFPDWSMKLVAEIDLAGLLSYTREWTPATGFDDIVNGLRGWEASETALSLWPCIYREERQAS